jgi:hypothetical protein
MLKKGKVHGLQQHFSIHPPTKTEKNYEKYHTCILSRFLVVRDLIDGVLIGWILFIDTLYTQQCSHYTIIEHFAPTHVERPRKNLKALGD